MASLVANFSNGFEKFLAEKGDPRTADWFLMSSPWPLASLLALYVWGCLSAGPRLMKDRKPFQLTNTLLAYNAIQVVSSLWLVYEGLDAAWLRDYNFRCEPVDYSNNPKAIRVAGAVWWYFMFKVIELLDTVFFVLRKKMNQVTFLHMYHHTMMPICAWIGVKFLPGGHGTLLGVINTGVHVIMYFYYMLAAMGPKYQKYLWWKPHVTIIQMIQFIVVFFHVSQVLVSDCNYPKPIAGLLSLNALVFLYMFGSFYYHAYILQPKQKIRVPQEQQIRYKTEQQVSNGNGVLLVNHVYRNGTVNGKLKDN